MGTEWFTNFLPGGYNTRMVLLSVTALGVASGVAGCLLVLRKRALVVDALSHATLPGLVLAYLIFVAILGNSRNLMVLLSGALAAGLLAGITLQLLLRYTRLKEDLVIGVILSTYFGLGIVLLSIVQVIGKGSEGGLNHYIYGQAASMTSSDALTMLVCAIIAAALVCIFFKEFRLLCFDSDFGQVSGMPPDVLDFLLLALAAFIVVIGLQAVGVLLMVAFLIIPAVSARFWTEKFSTMLILSGFFGGVSGFIGTLISASFSGLPAGAVIVLSSGVLFIISFLLAPARGMLFAFVRRLRLGLRISEDHLLREIHQNSLNNISKTYPVMTVRNLVGAGRFFTYWLLLTLQRRRYLNRIGDSFIVTEEGLGRARRLTEYHEMWEQYLARHSDLDALHLHHSADFAEHAFDDHLADRLKEAIREPDEREKER